MKVSTGLIAVVLIIGVSAAHGGSHQGLPEPGHLPGSMMYTVDQLSERVSLATTFSEKKKLEKRMKFAEERLSESVELARENRSNEASELAEKYSREIKEVKETASNRGFSQVEQEAESSENQSREVLQDLNERLPEEAQGGIQTALSNIGKGETGNQPGRQESRAESSPGGYVATGKVIQER